MKQDLEDMKKRNAGELDKANSQEVEALRQRIKQLENSEQEWQANVSTHLKSESALKCRIEELHLSEKKLLEEIQQLRMSLCRVETTTERVKSRVQNLQTQFTEVVQQQERAEAKHKGKLQRLQSCLKIKEDEVRRQSKYFEHCKQNQKQQVATLRKREAYLQSHVDQLEKEVRDLKAAISVLSGALQEETWQCLQGEMEAAFSQAVGSLPPSSKMEVADLKLLVEEVQCHIGSYLVVLKHQLKSLLGRGENSEMGTQGKESEGGQGDGFTANQKSYSLPCKLKPTEGDCHRQIKMPQGRDNPLKHELLPKDSKRKQIATGTEGVENEANKGLNVSLKMKLEEAIDPIRIMDSQTPCLMKPAEELCVLAKADVSRWHFSNKEFPDGFLIKYLKGNSGTWVAVAEDQSSTDTKKVVRDADSADALRNICLLFGCAPVKAHHGRGMRWFNGQGSLPDLRHAAANSDWEPMAVSEAQLPLPEYQNQEIRSSPKTSFPSLPNCISEADKESISGKDSKPKMEKVTEKAICKMPDDKPKICTSNKEKVGWVNDRGLNSFAEDEHCMKYELGNAPVKSENGTSQDQKAKFPVSHSIPEEVSQVLDKMIHRGTEEQAMKPICCPGRKGEECKPLSNAGRKEVFPDHAELQTEQGTRGIFDDDTGRYLGRTTISVGKKKQLQTELEQISLCQQRNERQKEKRDLEYEGSIHGSEEQNSTQGLTPQQEMASAELESSKRCVCPLDLVKQDRNGCPMKELSHIETASIYSQKMPSLTLENCWQLCLLQDKNHRYSLKICALEEEIDMYHQYLLEIDETNVTTYQKCFSTDDMCSDEFLKEEMVEDHQGASGTLWGKGGKSLPKKSFPSAAKQDGGRLGKQTSFLESKKATSLEERKIRHLQLLSCLKDERNNLLIEITQLVQGEEKGLEQNYKLEEEGERNLRRICLLEGKKGFLLRRLCGTKGEHQRCAVLLSELDEYQNMWIQAMFELEEEKFALQKSIERMQEETCSKCLETQNMFDNLKLEHEKLVKLMVAWGIQSEEQTPNGVSVVERGVQGMMQENEILRLDSKIEMACPDIVTAEKATQVTELVSCPVQHRDFDGKWDSCKRLSHDGESKGDNDNHFKHLLAPAPLDTHNPFATGQLLEMNDAKSMAKSIHETKSQVPAPSSSLCCAKQMSRVGAQEMSGKMENMSGNTRTLKEQLEKANEELKIQQDKLDKAKKEAQKWYVELGFAETRYEEVSTQLKDALLELQHYKEAKLDHSGKAPRSSVNEPQELVEEKFIIQKLEQQVLIFKAQLRDHGVLHHQYKALKKEMALLQMQIKEKDEELQRRESEAKLATAPFKAKLACLVQKCHKRNCLIAQLVQKLGQHGITEGMEEAEELVRDTVLSEYASAFALEYKQEFQLCPPLSPESDPEVCHAGANENAGPVAASVFPEAEGSCTAHKPSIKGIASFLKLTSPEKVIDFHRELSKNRRSNYQIDPLNRETASHLFPSCQRHQDVTSAVSKKRRVRGFSDPAHFNPAKRQEQLFQHSDVSQNPMGNLHTGAFDQGMKLKNVLMNNTWLSREKPGGSTSVAEAKSHLSDTVSSSNKCPSPLGEKTAASKRGNPMEITQGVPASVVSVHIIKTIGKNTLMIGWERPALDELGCSNGTFVTGYKVYIDGNYHKSITSSACTKAVLENLDLSVPFEVSVQSVGANGLVSGKRHVQYHCCWTKKEASETPFSLGLTESTEADEEERTSMVKTQGVADPTTGI